MEKEASAEYIKTKVIDFLIVKNTEILLGNEVMYGTKRKLVDLLMLDTSYLFGIEIKSSTDDLRRLERQIEEYHKIFNYTIICSTNKHFNEIKKLVSKEVGLLLFTNDSIELKRKPTIRKRLDKKEILYTIPASFLRKEYKIKNSSANSDEVRSFLLKLSYTELQVLLYRYFKEKLYSNFKMFNEIKGDECHIDDIPILSLKSTKIDMGNIY